MTILAAQWSLRSHDSLANFNMSTQLSNVWPQQKKPNSSNVVIIIALRQERCRCQYGSCTTLSVMKTGAATATDVHLAAWCAMLQQRPNAHYESQTRESVNTEARPCESACPTGTLWADSVISDWTFLKKKKGKNEQHGTARHGTAVGIWPNLTIHWRRKKGVESRKMI